MKKLYPKICKKYRRYECGIRSVEEIDIASAKREGKYHVRIKKYHQKHSEINYAVCSKPIVFLDIINTVIHQKCYYQSPYHRIPKKDEGTFKKILLKYPFFIDN
jgi:hypothetical protein